MLAILRKGKPPVGDSWAIPGGMVDRGEDVSATLAREFREEAGVDLDMTDARVVYRGYVDDPRNTDNAWLETTAKLKHLDAATAAKLNPQAGDDAKAVRWMPLTEDNIASLYANHAHFVRAALQLLQENGAHPSADVRRTEELVALHRGS
jgi:ADP-ribose pyrophosphatase